jgi:type II secretory pathway pseudopilin PulG
MARPTFHPRAFSLLELVVVAATITILSAIAIPRYGNSVANYRATMIARRIAADITLAQSRARALSTTQTVVFDLSQNRYQLPQFADPDRPGRTYTVSLSNPEFSATIVSADFGNSTTLSINGFGLPAAGGTVQVGSGRAARTLTVNAQSGVVTIQ